MKTLRPAILILAGSLLALGGCDSKQATDVSYSAISGDLTPEMSGLAERGVDIDRNMKVSRNMELRMLSDDIRRSLYWDHPSRLTPHSIPYTSGQPR